MTAQNTDPAAPQTDPAKEPTGSTPPWGDDFDPARAWDTIQKQREAEKELKAKLDAFEKAEQERSDAEKTELEKLQARLEKAEADLKAKAREALLAKSGLPEDLHDLVTADTDEGIAAQVAKLQTALGGQKNDGNDPAPEVKPSSRPQAALTPGHGGEPTPETDLDAIVAAVR
ncbi:scaffolding protein [Microbacterium phage GardenState]|uniref:Scaffolding protein n=1 Tax=Microbacterium phage GardenState TaxID=2776841 RepID=A0A7L8ZDB5_9CAUD|nr:scaffolding protein [Microbacterium phage GardenState]